MFEVADSATRSDLDTALQTIGARAPSELVPLLRAHLALRAGCLDQAESMARAAVAAAPQDPVARETLFRALNVLGASEAERFGPEPGETSR